MTTEDQLARIDALLAEVRALIAEDATPTPEPDPWPTAPLIVATMADEHRTLLMRSNNDTTYENTTRVAEKGEHTLTNPVPVTVVPTAEWCHLRETLAAADAGDFDFFLGSFRALIAATDALGLDQ